jgi:hypothetical protein
MINQLLPDQIATLWDYIRLALEKSIPPSADRRAYDSNQVLSALLSGKAQCWIVYEKTADVRKFEGVVITEIIRDDIMDSRSLLIYSLYGEDISNRSWREGLVALAKWGVKNKCKFIVGYTNNKLIVNKVLQFGGNISTFISVPIMEENYESS